MSRLEELAREIREVAQVVSAQAARLAQLIDALDREALESTGSTGNCPYDEILAEWNARCATVGMMPRRQAGVLKPKILRWWRKHPSLDLWRAAFDACSRNEHWAGKNGWRGSLESFLRTSHADRFFDQGLALGVTEPDEQPLGTTVDEEISRLLADPDRSLPVGFEGKDPREVRGKNDAEFMRRLQALQDYLENDWRFGS